MRTGATILVILAFLAAGCTAPPSIHPGGAQDPQAPAPGQGSLDGTVTDGNFIPIRDAKVSLKGTDVSTKTAWNGKFAFPRLDARSYMLVIEAIGWHGAEERVKVDGGRITTINLFLDPVVDAEPYHLIRDFHGYLDCVYLGLLGQSTTFSCNNLEKKIEFPEDWALTVTEAKWEGGASTNAVGVLTLSDEADQPYARINSNAPARIDLHPEFTHINGIVPTPPKGDVAPLVIQLHKAPQEVTSGVTGVVTVQQSFTVMHTTFYNEAPADVATYTALPDS